MIFSKISMAVLAQRLAKLGLDRPVVDQTGVEGNFTFALKLADDNAGLRAMLGKTGAAADSAPLMDGLEQAGLKLELRKLPAEVLVVDHVERLPADN